MVRHGRDKKRRSSRSKVKLKQRSWVRYDPKPKVNNALKEKWDPSKTPAANLALLGLTTKPNSDVARRNNPEPTEPSSTVAPVVELFDIPESDANYSKYKSRHPMSKDDEEFIRRCMTKFGDDYTAMFRDTDDVNQMQSTVKQLKKLGARYLLLSPEERQFPVPENIQHLIVGQASS